MSTQSTRPELARRIKQARGNVFMSQAALARAIGASQSTVADYETGRTEPSIAALDRIAAACSVSFVWLTTGEGEPGEAIHKKRVEEYRLDSFYSGGDLVLGEIIMKLKRELEFQGINLHRDFIVMAASRIRDHNFPEEVPSVGRVMAKIDELVGRERDRIFIWKRDFIREFVTNDP